MKLFSFILLSFSSLASFRAEVSLENRHYPKEIARESEDTTSALFTRLDYEYEGDELYFTGSGFLRFDFLDEDRRYGTIEDFYIEKEFSEYLKASVGYKIYNWTVMDLFHPVDNINSRNFDGEFERLEKRGELGIDIMYGDEERGVEAYFFPTAAKAFFPGEKSRQGVGSEIKETYFVKEDGDLSLANEWLPQFGLRGHTLVFDFELALSYLRHFDKNKPLLGFKDYITFPILAPKDLKNISASFYEVDELGLTFTGEWLGNILKFEGVYRNFLSNREFLVINADQTSSLYSPKDHSEISLGLERIISFETGHDLTLFSEWIGISGRDKTNYAFQNDLGLGLRYALNNISGSEFFAFIVADVSGREEGLYSLMYSQRLTEYMKIEGSYRGYVTNTGDSKGLDLLSDNHYFSLNIKSFF